MEQPSFDFLPERRVWTVSDLLANLRKLMEREYFDVWIEGEISNFHLAASRHCYFTLKDGQGQLRAALFAPQARLVRFKLQDGLQVRVRGRLSVYESRGELQCTVEYVEPLGRGNLQVAFDQLKQKLEAEGLFDRARKRPLPMLPRRIGLITSPRGAAVADMIRILQRRFPNIDVLLAPVAVQGEAAAGEIAAALAYFAGAPSAERVDVLIVGRGGGSLEDLWPFNEEVVARALAHSPIPTISAVGHETDFTIADFVADLRAPTPSAAAELAVRTRAEFEQEQMVLQRHLEQAMRYAIMRRTQRLDDAAHRAEVALHRQVAGARQQLHAVAERVQRRDVRAVLATVRARCEARRVQIEHAWRIRLAARRAQLERVQAQLQERNPLTILGRGYTLVYDGEGQLATTPEVFGDGDPLRVRFAAGWLDATAKKS